MRPILRHGAAILLVTSLLIFVVSLVGSIGVLNDMSSAMGTIGAQPRSGAILLSGIATALSNSVWAFGLACIVDRLDRHWGERS